jgi:hypothetical protein
MHLPHWAVQPKSENAVFPRIRLDPIAKGGTARRNHDLYRRLMMNRSTCLGLLAAGGLALTTIGSAQAYQGYPRSASHYNALPPLYVSSDAAQQACSTDKVVWLNWGVPDYHLPTDRWYHNTEQGAFACLGQTAQLGIPQGGK